MPIFCLEMEKNRLFNSYLIDCINSLIRRSMGRGYEMNAQDRRFESPCLPFLSLDDNCVF